MTMGGHCRMPLFKIWKFLSYPSTIYSSVKFCVLLQRYAWLQVFSQVFTPFPLLIETAVCIWFPNHVVVAMYFECRWKSKLEWSCERGMRGSDSVGLLWRTVDVHQSHKWQNGLSDLQDCKLNKISRGFGTQNRSVDRNSYLLSGILYCRHL